MKKSISLFLTAVLASSAVFQTSAFAGDRYIANVAASSSPVDRATVVETLYYLDFGPEVSDPDVFSDTEGKWYSDAAAWAYENGIVIGDGNGSFNGERLVTRAELAEILFRRAKSEGKDVSVGEDTNILSYTDAFDLPEWSYSAFQWACGAGVISAVDGYLCPNAPVSMTEFTDILTRYDNISALSLWNDDAEAKNALVSYIRTVTSDVTSENYIPVKDRIAVFDLDGTLFCETDPNYFDYTLLKYRVLEDPDYKDKASDFEREVALKIKDQNENGTSYPGLEVDHGKAVASAFAGMTVDEFNDYIQVFKKQPMPSYENMLRGDGWYLPMLQVVNYLIANEFTVYIISGTDRLIVRGIVYDSPMPVQPSNIIGSDEIIVSSNQGDADGLDYVFAEGDELILGGEFIIKNLKMNKVSVIMQEIGQQPVLSFGNSTGDSSMAEYVTSGNKYPSLAFMLCCDDTARENGNVGKADKMYSLCEEFNWIPVSMKNDWTTIYGDGIKYTGGEAGDEAGESETPEIANDNEFYIDKFNMTVTLPEGWSNIGMYAYNDDETSFAFYSKPIREAAVKAYGGDPDVIEPGDGGVLFYVVRYDEPMTEDEFIEAGHDYTRYRYIGATENETYVMYYASDVQIDFNDPSQQEAYTALVDEVEKVIFNIG